MIIKRLQQKLGAYFHKAQMIVVIIIAGVSIFIVPLAIVLELSDENDFDPLYLLILVIPGLLLIVLLKEGYREFKRWKFNRDWDQNNPDIKWDAINKHSKISPNKRMQSDAAKPRR